MAAPDLTQREVCFVQKIGTDDAGANAVGAPQPRLTIAAALADLAANYPPATSTFFHIVAVGPGTFTETGISLPPWTFIEGTCDGESQPTSIILLSADINLSSAWTANATARGGFSNLSIRAASGTPALDFTMPVPVAGNPLRTVELHNVHHNLVSEIFEATSTADNLVKEFCRQFGVNTDTFRQTGGTSRFNNVWSAALVTIIDKASFATVGTWDGLIVSATGSSLTASSIAAAGTTLRLTNSAVRSLILAQPAPGVLAVSADGVSIPIRSAVTYTGLASASNLTLLSDAAGEAYTPTTPANWSPVPTTVQGALDTLGASAGGGGGGTGNFAQIIRTGNRSSAAWGTAGCAINDTLNTFTDTTSAGAVAGVTSARSFGVPTFASAGGVTYAIAANIYIAGDPVITGGTATLTYGIYNVGKSRTDGTSYFANGAAATPGLTFTTSTGTGFFLNGAGTVGVTSAGTQSLNFGANGLIGGVNSAATISLPTGGAISVSAFDAITITAGTGGGNKSITMSPSGTAFTVFVGASQTSNIGSIPSSVTYGGLFLGATTPTATNFTVASNAAEVVLNAAVGSGAIKFTQANVERGRFAGTSGNLLIGGLTVDGTGQLQLTGTGAVNGITLNTTTGIYQSASNTLQIGSTAAYVQFDNGGSGSTARVQSASSFTVYASSNLFLFSNNSVAQTLDGSQNTTFAGRAIGASFGTATAAVVVIRYNSLPAITINNATATGLQFNGYGAGAITSDASGNLTAVSDARMKNVRGTYERGLKEICGLIPKRFQWNKRSGLSMHEMNAGFIAQEVLDFIPEAVSKGPGGIYTFADRPITAALVNAVKELASRLEKLEAASN